MVASRRGRGERLLGIQALAQGATHGRASATSSKALLVTGQMDRLIALRRIEVGAARTCCNLFCTCIRVTSASVPAAKEWMISALPAELLVADI